MTDLLAVLVECDATIERLNPVAVKSRIRALLKGGLPGGQGDGRRSANRADPGFDETDLWLLDQQDAYETLMLTAQKALREAEIVQGTILHIAEDVDGVKTEEADDKLWCTSCARIPFKCEPRLAGEALERFARKYSQHWAGVVEAKGLCSFCAAWWVVEGALVPEPVLQVHADGRRVTSKVLKECRAAVAATKKRKRKVKR